MRSRYWYYLGGLPMKVCVEFQKNDVQLETGFLGCDSVAINDCGQGDATFVAPLRLPSSGNIELDDTGTLAIDEGGTGTFTVKFDTKPNAAVTVDISSADTAAVSITPASLIFSIADYNKAQRVTVTGVQDTDNDNESVKLTIAATGGIVASGITKTVSVDDDEGPSAIVLDSADALKIDEGGSGTFTVRISPPSTPSVEVDLTSSDSDITPTPTTLTFAAGATAAQTVTVSAAQDADNRNESETITLSADSITTANVDKRISVKDDDIPAGNLVLDNTGALAIAEGGGGTFAISLDTMPNDDVTVSISSADAAAVSVSPASLTFTATDYDKAQDVTVTGKVDADGDNESVSLTIGASGGIEADDVTKTVTVDDKDPPPVMVVEGGSAALKIDEGGSGTFTVKIDPPSSRRVSITLTSSDSDITPSPATLTFAAGATAAQTVTVSAAGDNDIDNESETIALDTDDITVADVIKRISVKDDYLPPGDIYLDGAATLTIDEGGIETFSVRLGVKPNDTVTVDIRSADTGALTVNPASLTFTASNYDDEQEIVVIGEEDIDIADESVTITIEASGGIVADAVTRVFAVEDDDSPGSLVMLPSPLQVVEGGQEIFLVRLGEKPTVSSVVVNLSLTGNNPFVSLNPATLTFTDADWNADRRVTVFAQEDDNIENGTDTITGSYLDGSGNYASAANPQGAMLPLITLDRPGDIVPSVEMVELMEGGEALEFTVHLGEAPIGTDTVTITLSSANSFITVLPPVLLFTRNNWSEKQSATLQAGEDSNNQDGYGFITLSGDGGNYGQAMTTIAVSVVDNDGEDAIVGGLPGRTGIYALAIPPETSSDSSDIRIRCKQSRPCAVYFDCSSQVNGNSIQGWLPELIPAWGTRTVSASDIVRHTEDSWSGKGRLGCLLRSKENISAQVWTRSGDGVLVNNSALSMSVLDDGGDRRRADIESIPSPDGDEKTNLRIRCLAPEGEHCTRSIFTCYTDDGTMYEGNLGRIDRVTVKHLQTNELASLIDHRWQGMGLSCELRSDHHFTVQVMTRTGGGGALVNNSATGVFENQAR
ncbi:MAG: hypothetical protein ISN28_03780 [Ectothiorhodospiraceae bacterium AqS1]|nr:hypothetical protein [Ectothiorhodospiraceae bacterium AqS1]